MQFPMTQSAPLGRIRLVVVILFFFAVLFAANLGHADTAVLQNRNSTAEFRTEAADPGTKGLHNWTVDGIDQIFEQWFWYRVGDAGPEASLDTLLQTEFSQLNLDSEAGNDFLLAAYTDPNQTFSIQARYMLTGGTTGSLDSDIVEVIRIQNLSTTDPLNFHFFQYVDFDLGGTANDDTVSVSGVPGNTVRQSDSLLQLSETVVTPPPSRFAVSNAAASLRALLSDGLPTSLSGATGPVTGDAAWAFQWDFILAPGDSYLISKDKNLHPVPEPATVWTSIAAACALLLAARRIRANSLKVGGTP